MSFIVRWVFALGLVFLTFNPTKISFYHWVRDYSGEGLPFMVFGGIVLLILYVIYLRATWRSIGPIGLVLAAAFLGALIWVLIDVRLMKLNEPEVMTYVLLFLFATIMAIGLSWSHIRRRVTGQADVDDIDS